jgi:pimeloyl-ACP methyl ester carboxylesterase
MLGARSRLRKRVVHVSYRSHISEENIAMLAAHHVLARFPARAQLLVLDELMKRGIATRFGLFRMFFRTLVEIGADPTELEEGFRLCEDVGPSFVQVFRALAERRAEEARTGGCAHDHYRSALYALLADWASHGEHERARNYDLAISEFELFADAHVPRMERVTIAYRAVGLRAYYAAPEQPTAAVLLLPGNDEPKEWMVPMAEAACARRLAALAIDLPGYGENYLSGTRLDGKASLRDCARGALDFLASRGVNRVGVFGVSLGGLLAHLLAGLESGFAASAGLGGPHDLSWLFDHVPCLQRARFSMATDAWEPRDVRAMIRDLDVDGVLGALRGPALVVHGMDDQVVPVADARAIARRIGARTDLRLVAGADHMTNPHLEREAGHMMDWLAARLNARARLSIESRRELTIFPDP